MLGDLWRAAEYLECSLKQSRGLSNRRAEAEALDSLASTLAKAGDFKRAADLAEEALDIFKQLGDVLSSNEALQRACTWRGQVKGPTP
jgi:tetratricopeptide (TPR) repeat protein